MENNKKFGTGTVIWLAVLALLSLSALISYIAMTFNYYNGLHCFLETVSISVLFIAVAYYTVTGYKKPHGDLLRYVFLLFCVKNSVAIISDILKLIEFNITDAASMYNVLVGIIFRVVSILLTAYVAGRLDKVNKNVILLIIVLASHLANMILWFLQMLQVDCSFFNIMYMSTSFIFCLDLITAYILRYREHKEAGLADK